MYDTGCNCNSSNGAKSKYLSFSGIITDITNQNDAGCYQRFEVENENGEIVNFIILPTTYFIDHKKAQVGMFVTGYYNANTPVPLIYPPQYQAAVISLEPDQNVMVSYFNDNLVSLDETLQLNIGTDTEIILENGQDFIGYLADRDLIVQYGASTRSIPAMTTPTRIIVMC